MEHAVNNVKQHPSVPTTNDIIKVSVALSVPGNDSITVSRHESSSFVPGHSLINSGANGGVGGKGLRVLSKTGRKVDLRGIDNHELQDLEVCMVP